MVTAHVRQPSAGLVGVPCTAAGDATLASEQLPLLPERFLRKIEFTDSGCWLWPTSLNPNGYARIWWWRPGDAKGSLKQAHRVVYEILVGPIPTGLQLDHLCRVRNCVNPAHLEPVTHRENTLRGDTLPGRNARKTHCQRGHEFTPQNTVVKPDGSRRCGACRVIDRRRYREERKQRTAQASQR